MFDLQTHMLPGDPDELRKVGHSLGLCATRPQRTALAAFEADYKQKTELNRKILDHLLHDAFSDDAKTEPESRSGARPRSGARADCKKCWADTASRSAAGL